MSLDVGKWWLTPLTKWADALGFAYAVRRGQEGGQPGEWTSDGDRCLVQLDSEHYAQITGDTLTEATCAALGWTLQAASATYFGNWKQLACDWAGGFSELAEVELFRQFHTPSEVAANADLRHRLPGYFVWLEFHAYQPRSITDLRDFRQSAEHILEAFAPGTAVGWIASEHNSPSLLTLWSSATLADTKDQSDDDEWPHLSSATQDRRLIGGYLRELIEVFATDALAPTQISVGARISTPAELLTGLSTTVAAKNARAWISPQQTIVMWGEEPMIALFQSASKEAMTQFMQAAHLRSQSEDLHLSKEMVEALEGLIQANLNVSEASRILYIHRNTLMNRIERIRLQTGYDIRQFHDALLLWSVQRLYGKFGS